MRNFTISLSLFLCLCITQAKAQDATITIDKTKTFEESAKAIAEKINVITKEEKAALKEEVEAVNKQLEAGTITSSQADEQKIKLAEKRANNIESRTTTAQNEMTALIKGMVDGQLAESDSTTTATFSFKYKKGQSQKDSLKGESRTTSQFVFALGANNLVTNEAVAHSDFRYAGSHFYEWGVTWNTRILKENNLLHVKYGLSLMYNNLRPTDNRFFVENGKTTDLLTSDINLRDSRFRNVNLVVPVHFEFDFSGKTVKDGVSTFRTHESFRFGIGGFAGVNVKSKQILKFDNEVGNKVTTREKGDFNTNDFVYGVSTYIGYKQTSLYLKYDLSPLFADNLVDQNNISLGLRFDLN